MTNLKEAGVVFGLGILVIIFSLYSISCTTININSGQERPETSETPNSGDATGESNAKRPNIGHIAPY